MKIAIQKKDLSDAIAKVLPAISMKSNIPALEGILVKTKGDSLELTAYDLEIGIETAVSCSVVKHGAVILPGRIFSDIVRKMPEDSIVVEVHDSLKTTISCRSAVYDIIGLSALDFPEMPRVTGEQTVSISQQVLKSMISETIFSVSTNDNKPVQMGSLFDIKDDSLYVVAVDGFRLAMRKEAIVNENACKSFSFVIPGGTQKEVMRLLSDNDGAVIMVISQKHIIFTVGETMIISRLIEGAFLKYEGVIPKESTYKVKVKTRDLQDSIERVSLVADERLKTPIHIKIDASKFKISCDSAQNRSYDECVFDGAFDPLDIAFNFRFLLDVLRNINDDEIFLQYSTPTSACLFKPLDSEQFLYMVLPVRL